MLICQHVAAELFDDPADDRLSHKTTVFNESDRDKIWGWILVMTEITERYQRGIHQTLIIK